MSAKKKNLILLVAQKSENGLSRRLLRAPGGKLFMLHPHKNRRVLLSPAQAAYFRRARLHVDHLRQEAEAFAFQQTQRRLLAQYKSLQSSVVYK